MSREREVKNGQIERTFLGVEDHGILTAVLTIVGSSWGQGFGTYTFGAADQRVTSPFGMEFIRRVLETVGVESWEELEGKYVRIDHDFGKIYRLGHITADRWFDPDEAADLVSTDERRGP